MTELQQKIHTFIKLHQPVSVEKITSFLGITRYAYWRERAGLIEAGKISHMNGVGVFAGEQDMEAWKKGEGAEILRRRAEIASDAAKGYARGNDHGRSTAFQRYNPRKNPVVKEYMKSAFRQRLMMVYGRMA